MMLSPRYEGPVIMSVDAPFDAQAVPCTRQRRRLESLLAGLTVEQWQIPSRCDGWSVADVVAHLVGVNAFWQLSVEMGRSGGPTKLLPGFDPAATPSQMVAGMGSLSGEDLLDQLVASNDGFLASFIGLDEEAWSLPAESPVGHVPIRLVVQHALWDAWVHERDIALPLGLVPAEETDEVQSCLVYAAVVSPALAFGLGCAVAGEFAVDATDPATQFVMSVEDSVVVDAAHARDAGPDTPCLRGSAVELIEALSMRGPMPPSSPLEWTRLRDGLATAFDAIV